jgi:hypothetical protein
MADEVRRARLVQEMEQIFVPEFDAGNVPSTD